MTAAAIKALCRWPVLAAVGASCSGVVGYIIGVTSDSSHPKHPFHAARAATAAVPQPHISDDTSVQPIESRASQIMRFGYPDFDNLRTFEDFVLSYDRRNRIPRWVFEHLTPDRLTYDASVDRSKCSFHEDASVHAFFRSQNSDYKGSGYDRGHMAAAGNHRKSQQSINQTFLLSNMAPQVGQGFNRDKWNDLEKYCRKLARNNPNIYVCTGPLFLPKAEADGKLYVKYEVIGKQHVAVPTHFFKVILIDRGSGQFDLESYVLPNRRIDDAEDLGRFRVPLESIERAAGFLIFDKLARSKLKSFSGKLL